MLKYLNIKNLKCYTFTAEHSKWWRKYDCGKQGCSSSWYQFGVSVILKIFKKSDFVILRAKSSSEAHFEPMAVIEHEGTMTSDGDGHGHYIRPSLICT